jgi:hypothetical protein
MCWMGRSTPRPVREEEQERRRSEFNWQPSSKEKESKNGVEASSSGKHQTTGDSSPSWSSWWEKAAGGVTVTVKPCSTYILF